MCASGRCAVPGLRLAVLGWASIVFLGFQGLFDLFDGVVHEEFDVVESFGGAEFMAEFWVPSIEVDGAAKLCIAGT